MSAHDSRIGKTLGDIIPGLKKERPRLHGSSQRCYIFPPLAECRLAFEHYLGGKIDWLEPEE